MRGGSCRLLVILQSVFFLYLGCLGVIAVYITLLGRYVSIPIDRETRFLSHHVPETSTHN